MAYSKLPEWPIVDPDNPPVGYLEVGRQIDQESLDTPWHFYVTGDHLVIVRKAWCQFGEEDPGEFVSSQYEYPIGAARWFVSTIERFFLEPDHPNAVPRADFNVRGEVAGEALGVTRGAQYGSVLKGIPGYSLDNLNRFEHGSLGPSTNWCQMFKMGDPWLFEQGLLEVFKDIAERHERGEF